MSDLRKKIAIFYPYFLGGGAEAVCLWMLEALRQRYNVTLFTLVGIDFGQMNRMYGTDLSAESIQVKPLFPEYLKTLVNFSIANNRDIRKILIHLLLRYLKKQSIPYDLLISAYNAADLGQPGIQYIHWVKVIEGGKTQYNRISNFSLDRLKQNLSLVNSNSVANTTKATYGVNAQVIHPPVVIEPSSIPWQNKENAFICSGRLTEAKSPHRVIEILQNVRSQGFDIKLYLTGGGGGLYAWNYKRFLNGLVKMNQEWVYLWENLSYEDYVNVLSRCKYGIHFKEEPFGISIAEMVKAGAIPFVRSQGGQVEIVGEQGELLFDHADDAVTKIVQVLSNTDLQEKLLSALEQRKSLFSTQRFMTEIAQIVDDYCKQSL